MTGLLAKLSVTAVLLLACADRAFGCVTDSDCQLNGACDAPSSTCKCDKGWMGDNCGTLHLDPEAHVAYGHGSGPGSLNHSSWGGGPPVYDRATGKYHLFVSELAAHCGMSTWMRMSQSVRATADSPEGPYTRQEVVIGTESHNTYYGYSPTDGMHLIYTIFPGESPRSCNPPPPNCSNGVTPGGDQLHYRGPWASNTCNSTGKRTNIRSSRSLLGPWETHAIDFSYDAAPNGTAPPNCGTSNPAPYVFPNGTVLMVARGKDGGFVNHTHVLYHNIWLYRAPAWNATYEWVPSDGVNGALKVGAGTAGPPTEDPTLYRGRRGFHILFHSSPDLTHAWSEDGLSWSWNKTVMGPAELRPLGGGDNERPRVLLDDDGDLDWVFVGQLLPPGGSSNVSDAARTAAFRAL